MYNALYMMCLLLVEILQLLIIKRTIFRSILTFHDGGTACMDMKVKSQSRSVLHQPFQVKSQIQFPLAQHTRVFI